jgi:hypothetical protein
MDGDVRVGNHAMLPGGPMMARARNLRAGRNKSVYEVQCDCGWKTSMFLSMDHARRWGRSTRRRTPATSSAPSSGGRGHESTREGAHLEDEAKARVSATS